VEALQRLGRELMDGTTGSVYVFPMCREDFERVRILGQGFDRKLVADAGLMKVV
jgi:CRISPR-associated protein Cas2